jgi:replicative DNA helicase
MRDFYNSTNRILFGVLQASIEQTQSADIAILADKLRQTGSLKVVGGLMALSKLGDWSTTRENLEYHCKVVKNLSNQRKMILVAQTIAGAGLESKDPEKYLSESLRSISELATQSTSLSVTPMGEGFASLLREIYSDKPPRDVTLSGLGLLDLKIGGFPKGLVTVIAGDTSMGKSLVALNLALRMANSGTRVFYATLEDKIKNQQRRAVSIRSGVPLNELKRCGIHDPVKCNRVASAAPVGQLPIDWCDKPTTAGDLCNMFRGYKCRYPNDEVVFIVDHLLYLRSSRRETEYDRVTNGMRSLADCAKDVNSSVIALCQLNRDNKQRSGADKAPMLSDLRSSGAIEQDARLILGVYRPYKYDKEADPNGNRLELHVLKNTDGPAGFEMVFKVDLTTVSVYEEQEGY